MKKEVYFAKSLEEDFATKTLKGQHKVTFQTLSQIIKKKKILPNTKSFGRKRRLSCTIIHKNYLKTYRPQGIIFQTKEKPDYVLPFDLVLLSATNNIIVQYYRIKNNLHQYYGHALIKGFEKFIFKDLKSLVKKYSSPRIVWNAVNQFRKLKGYKILKKQKYRLVLYNEAVFHKPIKVTPVAIFGYRKEARALAKNLRLAHYRSTKEFYENRLRES